jgi:Ca2+/Na+ antiporter
MAPPPKKQMRWGRVFGALIVLGGIIAGVIVLITR